MRRKRNRRNKALRTHSKDYWLKDSGSFATSMRGMKVEVEVRDGREAFVKEA